jgi:hypothetical protein
VTIVPDPPTEAVESMVYYRTLGQLPRKRHVAFREPDHCYLGDPRTANLGAVGLARYATLRSWLGQWSYEHSAARGAANAARIRETPVLQIENSVDDAVSATHNATVRTALASPDASYHLITGATHYYVGQPEHLAECVETIEHWCTERDLLP